MRSLLLDPAYLGFSAAEKIATSSSIFRRSMKRIDLTDPRWRFFVSVSETGSASPMK